ncbi:MAG: hypothetical protein A2513_09190 [Sulfurimonas sp. RIFOXYD12_FULL_33_39]|uniref:hypothetical protein n=1 Tax=unclassified Sulfurimonas TaxID=2623549 RepID=UPI0008D39E44|nr:MULTISPECIES: hypothetical protein [unclassified Sulfurimonas]OHE07407.1 MAG: hypothetical protein A3G74_01775 [Sulfurimonas sp. RIFCSPLOWO2_12_FULL_34_6]OHE10251.1 MAG: hypothetical protein A2513_09190 [Sulfurimonas sp. RIFOXYD12_FULL_33_39]OHE14528.1 MAG: hypothetical protein A2530_01290 [Sulfurimonas sp. RIFOXYD2_FULL_34_21]DAB27924.1 MAG TPA: hypothetical protein CFH78_05280 [Sulfurimonas sp. UBA10385]
MKFFIALLYIFLASSLLHGYSKKIVLGTFSDKANADRQYEKLSIAIPQYKLLQELSEVNNFDIHVRPFGKYHIVVVEPIKNASVLNESLQIVKGGFKQALVSDVESASESVDKVKKEIKIELPKAVLEQKKELPKKEPSKPVAELKQEFPMPVPTPQINEQEVVVEVNKNLPVQTADKSIEQPEQNQLAQNNLKDDIKELTKQNEALSTEQNTSQLADDKVCPPPSVSDVFSEYFSWTYLLILLIIGILAYLFMKFKHIYDQY